MSEARSSGAQMLILSSIVATDMAQIAFESLKGVVDFDFEAQAVSVEQSCQDILRIVGRLNTFDPDKC